MPKKRANLIFSSGASVLVPVADEIVWPEVIEHQTLGKCIRFTRIGVQHGIGTYTELVEETKGSV